jgi:ABC-type sugar transport system substrate-binding protein
VCPHSTPGITGVQQALAGAGVKVVMGGAETQCDAAKGATVAEDLLTREPNAAEFTTFQ